MQRGAEGSLYTSGEFPMLEAACQANQVLAVAVDPAWEAEDDLPDVWTAALPPTPEELAVNLAGERRLLLAVPLAVRGKALGVLLMEEPELASSEDFGGLRSHWRLREKRLEITLGISQQAALAIENDRLQREMVVRERLEREIQLAREVQRTFLPRRAPYLPGWQVKFLWQTAREVGGDLYDFIELPASSLAATRKRCEAS